MNFFSTKGFMPHGHCYLWKSDILFLNVASDIIIAMCYFTIPLLLGVVVLKQKNLPFRKTFILFILFVFLCGVTHVFEIINVWIPIYQITGIVKFITAIVSLMAAGVIIRNFNFILSFPTFQDFEQRISNDMYALMKNLPIGIILSNDKGKINYSNRYISELFEYSEEELNEKDVEVLIPKSKRDTHYKYKNEFFLSPIEKTMGAGRVLEGLTKNGEMKKLEIGLRPIKVKFNNENNLIVAIKDITEDERNKKILEEHNEIIKVATYGIPSLLSYLDRSGTYRFVNQSYQNYWGINPEKIVGRSFRNLIPEESLEEVSNYIYRTLSGETLNFKIDINFPMKGTRKLDVFYIPHVNNDEIMGIIVLAHDITDLTKIQSKLEYSNQQLEEYAFLVSHDLRAPVRHIANYLELFVEELKQTHPLSEKEVRYFSIIKDNTEKIHKMISGMLKVASISQIEVKKELINISIFMTEIVHKISRDTILEISKNNIDNFYSDPDLIEIIISNLVENSLNFKNLDTTLKIKLEFNKIGKALEINYKDNGPGIDPDLIDNMFTAFIKSENSKGLGLGLNIVRKSVQKIDGDIKCMPCDEGACFSITLKNAFK